MTPPRTLALDVGGTYLRYRVDEGEVTQTEANGWEERVVSLLQSDSAITRVGIAFAGQVEGGKIASAPNLAVTHHDIVRYLSGRFAGVEVAIDNDLKCAALAYRRRYGADSVAVLYAGTGLGSALISEGRVVRGCANLAGEIGHVGYREAPFACGCGKYDCFELYASGSGIEKHRRHYGLDAGNLDAWLEGKSPKEAAVAEEALEAFVRAASLLITLHNPAILVIGGGVIGHNPLFTQRALKRIEARTFAPAMRRCRIFLADLEHAPLEGAGLLFS